MTHLEGICIRPVIASALHRGATVTAAIVPTAAITTRTRPSGRQPWRVYWRETLTPSAPRSRLAWCGPTSIIYIYRASVALCLNLARNLISNSSHCFEVSDIISVFRILSHPMHSISPGRDSGGLPRCPLRDSNTTRGSYLAPKLVHFCEQDNTDAAVARHNKGCNCKKSFCLKKYCECFQAAIFCSENCKCIDCKNYEVGATLQSPPTESSNQFRMGGVEFGLCPSTVLVRVRLDGPTGSRLWITRRGMGRTRASINEVLCVSAHPQGGRWGCKLFHCPESICYFSISPHGCLYQQSSRIS